MSLGTGTASLLPTVFHPLDGVNVVGRNSRQQAITPMEGDDDVEKGIEAGWLTSFQTTQSAQTHSGFASGHPLNDVPGKGQPSESLADFCL